MTTEKWLEGIARDVHVDIATVAFDEESDGDIPCTIRFYRIKNGEIELEDVEQTRSYEFARQLAFGRAKKVFLPSE